MTDIGLKQFHTLARLVFMAVFFFVLALGSIETAMCISILIILIDALIGYVIKRRREEIGIK